MSAPSSAACADTLDLAAAVALDAADDAGVRRLEEHTQHCSHCAEALREFREVASALGSAAPQVDVPADLRERVLSAARATPRVGRRSGMVQFRRPRVSPYWAAVAASVIVSLGSLIWVAMLHGQMLDLQNQVAAERDRAARYDHIVQVLASPQLAVRPLTPAVQTLQSRGMVYMDPGSGTGMLSCHDLPPLQPGHAWQIWFVRGTERISGGMLWPDQYGNGYTLIRVPSDLQSFDAIGMTEEPWNGSAWPTTPRIMGTPLKQASN